MEFQYFKQSQLKLDFYFEIKKLKMIMHNYL